MKQSHLRDDTETPLVHENNESSQPLRQVGPPQYRSRVQPDITPRRRHKVKASTCGLSTAHYPSNAADSACPEPLISTSQDQLDLHEALRSQLPPFRQSKRWAKTYMNEKDTSELLPFTESRGTRNGHPLACDMSHEVDALTVADAVSISDDDSKHYGFCRPMKITGWQLWHHRRLFKRSLNPVRVVKMSESKSIRHKRSTESLEAPIQVSRRRAAMPKAVQSKSRTLKKQQAHTQVRSPCLEDPQQPRMSPGSFVSDLTNSHHEQSGSPVSPIHDYEKVKRFSEECVNMLSGLDFGEEWRLSVIGPRLSLPRKLSCEAPIPKAQSIRDPKASVFDVGTATQRLDTAVWAFRQTSSQPTPADAAKQTQSINLTCKSISSDRNKTMSTVGDGNCGHGDLSSSCSFSVANENSSKSTSNHFSTKEYTRDLENTRSVDTLTKIEAQVEVPDAATHQLQKKDSCFTLSSSPKRQRPSGGPPKGPLPSLPKEDTSNNRSVIEKFPSFTISHESKVILHTLNLADPFKSGSVKTVVTAPNHSPSPASRRLKSNGKPKKSSGTVNYELTSSDSSSICSAESWHKSNKIIPSATSTSRGVAVCRNSKVQEIGRRDADKWSSSQEDMNASIYEASLGRSTTSIETQRKCLPLQLPASKPGTLLSNVVLHSTSNKPQQPTLQTKSGTPALLSHRIMSTNNLPVVIGSKILDNRRRVASKAGPARVNQANRGKKLHPAVSSPNLYQRYQNPERPKQALEHSQIMIVVDTEPHTSDFRTGASSHSNVVYSRNRPMTPICAEAGRQAPQTPPSKPTGHEHPTSAELDKLAELIDIVKPPSSIQKKKSSRGLRGQETSIRLGTSIPIAFTPERRSSTRASFRSQPISYNPTLDDSDSDLEDSPLLKEYPNPSTTKPRSKLRTCQVKSHLRKNTLSTSMLKGEVHEAEEQIENLKKYEERIEDLQLHLDQTMKVWDRMTHKGKRRYLESVFNATDQNSDVDSILQAQTTDIDAASVAATSMSSKNSSVQKMSNLALRSLAKTSNSTQTPEEVRCISSMSTVTSSHDNTDTNIRSSIASRDSFKARRVSGGSLTDPQDYNFPPLPRARRPTDKVGVTDSRSARKTKVESLGANLDDFRTRLQASRPPVIPTRRCRLESSSLTTDLKEMPTRPGTAATTVTMSSSNRFAIAPWEEQDEVLQRNVKSSLNEESVWDVNDSNDYGYFEPDDEVIRTDQMDAMLAL